MKLYNNNTYNIIVLLKFVVFGLQLKVKPRRCLSIVRLLQSAYIIVIKFSPLKYVERIIYAFIAPILTNNRCS